MSRSVEENYRKLRCTNCGTEVDLGEDAVGKVPPCAKCGVLSYKRVGVVAVCDFCSTPFEEGETCWTYPCGLFIYPFQPPGGPTEWNSGPWSACGTCHELIQAGDLTLLSEHCVETEIAADPMAAAFRGDLLKMISALHRAFDQHRTGEPFEEVFRDGEWVRVEE